MCNDCPHGYVYCYAVQNRKLAQKRDQEHDTESEYLLAGKLALHSASKVSTPTLF